MDDRPLAYILDEHGEPEPIDLLGSDADVARFALFMAHDERRFVRQQTFTTGQPACEVEVSTVFLGNDHAWDDGPPVLWETMVFGLPGEQQICKRYTSRAAAIAGHNAIVASLGGPVLE